MLTIRIIPNDSGHPAGKLADAELHWTADEYTPHCSDPEPLAGLKLIGFGIWERRTGAGRNVTFPARQYTVNGERRSFALLRPIADTTAQNAIRDAILQAYDNHEADAATAAVLARPVTVTVDEARARQSQETTTPAADPDMDAERSNSAFDADTVARELWRAMDDNERHGVKFGLFPARIMPTTLDSRQSHALTVALMRIPTVGPVTTKTTTPQPAPLGF